MTEKLEIYKLAAEMADRVSVRRMTANSFFLAVNSALFVLEGFAIDKLPENKRVVIFFMATVGIVLSLTWFFALKSYRKLNGAKYGVILDMEKTMRQKIFGDEWEKLKRVDSSEPKSLRDKWIKYKDRYTDLTNIESAVPVLFGIAYLLVIFAAAFKLGI